MKDKLDIIRLYKSFIEKFWQYNFIFPRKYYSLKDIVEGELLDFLKSLYIANDIRNIADRVRKKEELIARIKYIASLLRHLVTLKVISEKQYKALYADLEKIYYLLIGWLQNDRKNLQISGNNR